jgi:DNA repair protein RecN (Recombination protein N)
MAGSTTLAEVAGALVDLHGQHAHQSLLAPAVQRAALDASGGADLAARVADRARARQRWREISDAQAALGGDARTRARELDLWRFQRDELWTAGLDDADEEERLREEEERLADAEALRDAAGRVYELLADDGGAIDRLGSAVAALAGRASMAGLEGRLRGLEAELADAASEARAAGEGFASDPARLADVAARRHLLRELGRKYGDSIADMIAYRDDAERRVAELESYESRAAELERQRIEAERDLRAAEQRLGAARRAAAPELAAAIGARLAELALPRARFEVEIGSDPAGESVVWLLGANPGEPALPLSKVASGGELARTMLAARLVLSGLGAADGDAARTLVFDEVDAGIGGEAAVAVGRALAALGRHHQVLVVTHLPQVAAFADAQLVVRKREVGERTVAAVEAVDGQGRVIELSRMLSGQPESTTARRHAKELLELARAARGASPKSRGVTSKARRAG